MKRVGLWEQVGTAEKVCCDGGGRRGEAGRSLSGCSNEKVPVEEEIHFISLG